MYTSFILSYSYTAYTLGVGVKAFLRIGYLGLVFFGLGLLGGCLKTPHPKEALHQLALSDLKFICNEAPEIYPQAKLLKNPFYIVHAYRDVPKQNSKQVLAYAELRFYYLESPKFYQRRYFRLRTHSKSWERYEIELKHILDPPPENGKFYRNGGKDD